MPPLEIGMFHLLPAPENRSDGDVIRHALAEADFAEGNGFDSVWVTEHHLSSFGLVGAPSVYAAALAQRTRRIDIGYAVAVVPLHHPVRLAEEIAWLTHLSGGRVLVGLGPGFSAFEFGAYGVPLEERHERLEEGSRVLKGLLSGRSFRHEGRFWTVPEVALRPRPLREPRFLRASSTEESCRQAARAGEPLMLGLKSLPEIAERLELYRSVRRESGASSAEIGREIGEFRVLRRIVVAATDSEALALARRALAWEVATARRVHEQTHEVGKAVPVIADGSAAVAGVELVGGCVGSPATVLEELGALADLGIRHAIAWLNFGDLPYESVRRSMELMAREVIPLLAPSPEEMTA